MGDFDPVRKRPPDPNDQDESEINKIVFFFVNFKIDKQKKIVSLLI